MDRVTVAELKARLSHYLREVRAGKSFVVVSRDIPVATLGPFEVEEAPALEILEPTSDPTRWGVVDLPPLGRSFDVVGLLGRDEDQEE